MSFELRGRPFTFDELHLNMYGMTNRDIIEYLMQKKPDEKTFLELSRKKEELYRKMCLSHPDKFLFAEGVTHFLDFLKENQIPRTIATASGRDNVEFFNRHLKLEKWFDIDSIIYDNGSIPGKPAPDFYLLAADKIRLKPFECVVIEDSAAGLLSAERAGIGKIIALVSDPETNTMEKMDRISQIIHNFKSIDYYEVFN